MPIYLRFCRIVILMDPPLHFYSIFRNLLIPHTQTISSVWSTYAKSIFLRLFTAATCTVDTSQKPPKSMQAGPRLERPRQMAAAASIVSMPDIGMAGQEPK